MDRQRILIVDDRSENLAALETILRDLDVETVRAGSGNEALTLLLEQRFAMVILDVQMPDMDGFETLEIMRQDQSTATLPVIFVSAVFQDEYSQIRGVETGAVDFMTKPVVPEILRGKVKVLLELDDRQVALDREVEARKAAEKDLQATLAELARSNKELERFAYAASHDLRSPLRHIIGFLDMLETDLTAGRLDSCPEYLGFAVSAARRMDQLIKALLSYSRVAKEAAEPEPVDVGGLLDTVLGDLRTVIREADATVESGRMPRMMGHPNLLGRLFQNLVENALKYRSDAPPRVEISAAEGTDGWTFCVTDNGRGIAPEHHDRIFAAFQRLHTYDEIEGAGIGLSLCQRIVEIHGGRIWVDSAPGEGACFSFLIPTGDVG